MDSSVVLQWFNDGLDLIGINNSGQIRVGKDLLLEVISLLLDSGLGVGSENFVKGLEGGGGPDHESSELTTRGQLGKIKSVHVGGLDSRHISEGLYKVTVLIGIDH